MTFFSLVFFFSLLVALIIGLALLLSKAFDNAKKKAFGIALMAMALFNFIYFNMFLSTGFSYTLKEVVALALFFLVLFIEGLIFLVAKEVNNNTRKAFGAMLLVMVALWAVVAALSV